MLKAVAPLWWHRPKSVESEPTASTSVIPARRAEPGMDPGPSTLNRMSCAGHMAALAGHLVESAAGPKTGLVLWHLHSSLGTLALPLSGMVPFLEVEGQQCAPPPLPRLPPLGPLYAGDSQGKGF